MYPQVKLLTAFKLKVPTILPESAKWYSNIKLLNGVV